MAFLNCRSQINANALIAKLPIVRRHTKRPITNRPRIAPGQKRDFVDDAFDLSQYSTEVDFELPGQPDLERLDLELWNEDLQNLTTPELLELSFSLEKYAGEADKLVDNVLSAGAGRSSSRFLLINSKGLSWSSRRNSTMAGVSLTAAKGDVKKSGGKYKGTRFFDEFDAEAMAARAAEKAISMLEAKPIEAGSCPVLFDYWMSPGIIRPFLSATYAETVQKGQSKLKDKVGELIAAECLTITNDPFVPGMPGSGQIDSEGVPSRKFDLIKNGRLMTFLYNLQSARKAGCAPTGNGKRSYAGKAGTGFDNLFVEKGNRSRQEILNSLDRCLMVTKFEGSGIRSAVSGETACHGCESAQYAKIPQETLSDHSD